MDIQSQLVNAERALNQHRISSVRRLLGVVKQISSDRFLVSMAQGAIDDVNQARFHEAQGDIRTAKLIDERNNFAMEL